MLAEKYHDQAKQQSIQIIPCCGYDSVPADMGTFFVLDQLPKEPEFWNKQSTSSDNTFVTVEGCLEMSIAGVSGGTYTTLVNSVSSYFKGKSTTTTSTTSGTPKFKKQLKIGSHFDKNLNAYVVPFQTSDPAIVRRSSDLNNYTNGGIRSFEYANYLQIASLWNTILFWIFAIALFVLSQFSLGRRFLQWVYREPGQGPSEAEQKKSYFKLTLFCNAVSTRGKHTIVAQVAGADPYIETAHIACECAWVLLQKHENLGGVLTPSAAFGQDIIQRLQDTGITFTTKRHSFERHAHLIEQDKQERELNKYVYMD